MARSIRWLGIVVGLGVIGAIVMAGRSVAGPSATQTTPAILEAAQQQPDTGVAGALEADFIRISEMVGPAIVGISTEQIEKVRQFMQGHPFFGNDPMFEEFFGGRGMMEGPPQEFARFGLGSGVIIDARGYVLTNEHVVADADKITITLSDGRSFPGEVKGKDARTDLAVVKINADGMPFAKLGDSSKLRTGQWVIAMGNPFGLMTGESGLPNEPTLTVGVISAMNRRLPKIAPDRDYSGLIQTDAAINPGNSGGPLLNLKGEVIGINVAILTSSRGSEGIGFAIPADKAKRILTDLIEGRKVVYGWLGVEIGNAKPEMAKMFGLKEGEAVLVNKVIPGSPADQAGLQRGDLIRSLNGEPIRFAHELSERVATIPAGNETEMEVFRDGKPLTLKVKIGERPATNEGSQEKEEESWRGIRVAELSSPYAEEFDIPKDGSGVLVIAVDPASPAADAGIFPGEVIEEINRQPIANIDSYQKAIAKIQPLENALVRTHRKYAFIKGQE